MEIVEDVIVDEDPWLRFRRKAFRNRDGEKGGWSYVERVGQRTAAVAVARTGGSDALILIRQFRIPFERYVLEFPAGLVDPNETPGGAALRELEEETGYTGRIIDVGPPVSSSAGLTTEQLHMVLIEAEDSPANAVSHEASEEIEVVRVEKADLSTISERAAREGWIIDAKLYTYIMSVT